ncbi:MAG TPA: hypothetical protein DCS93_06610 [Microscillaceae bacterium]|nr:hypothetical protein [Microscillaceae bacterium]
MNSYINNQQNTKRGTESSFIPFAQSPIWQLQREYFENKGIQAWSTGEVPHYVTNNPYTAKVYANIVLGFLRDHYAPHMPDEPVYIVELGTGSGRLTYHLLLALVQLAEAAADQIPPFVYVMTDFVQENLDFWEIHPRLKPFFESGILDYALFDAEKDTTIYLQKHQRTLTPKSVSQPIVALANYFFDAIPQELFYIDEGQVYQTLIHLGDFNDPDVREMDVRYGYELIEEPPFEEPSLRQLFRQYQQQMENSHLLFPHIGLRCLTNIKALSLKGLLLITADKAAHQLEKWQNRPEPYMAPHGGCFSLTVNYHALKEHCHFQGGKALLPSQASPGITIGAFLYVNKPENCYETLLNYQAHVNDFGTDDFFSIKKHIEQEIPTLSPRSLFAYLRLAHYDVRLFRQFLPRFQKLASTFNDQAREEVLKTAQRVWRNYYPMGESYDLAAETGFLLQTLQFPSEAITFFQWSEQIQGSKEEVQYQQALCYQTLGEIETCKALLEKILAHNPRHQPTTGLLNELLNHH